MPIREPHTNVTLTENVTKIDVDKVSGELGINITQDNTILQIRGVAISESNASQIAIQPVSTLTASNIQDALQQLADQDFRSNDTPTGTNVSEGDTWYDLDDNIMKVYREISSGVFAWTNLVVAETNDTLDAGAF
jgi:hypothetical protein